MKTKIYKILALLLAISIFFCDNSIVCLAKDSDESSVNNEDGTIDVTEPLNDSKDSDNSSVDSDEEFLIMDEDKTIDDEVIDEVSDSESSDYEESNNNESNDNQTNDNQTNEDKLISDSISVNTLNNEKYLEEELIEEDNLDEELLNQNYILYKKPVSVCRTITTTDVEKPIHYTYNGIEVTLDTDDCLYITGQEQYPVKSIYVFDVNKKDDAFIKNSDITNRAKTAIVDLKNVTSLRGLFANCSNLESVDLTKLDCSKVTDMSGMFANCEKLKTIKWGKVNTSKVDYMNDMFHNCYNLESVDVSKFDTSNVLYMSSMFEGCKKLKSLNLKNFNTSEVMFMEHMFSGCQALESLNLSSFNTSNVENMRAMFSFCGNLKSLDIRNFDLCNVYYSMSFSDMFYSCVSLSSIVTPKNICGNLDLPVDLEGKAWVDSKGNECSSMPAKSETIKLCSKCDVTYELNGGTNNSKNKSVYLNNTTVTLSNPTKTGYLFDGWYNKETDEKVTKFKASDYQITLVAKWRPITYTVTYNGNGGKYNVNDKMVSSYKINVTYNGSFTAQSYAPCKKGYTFKGYSTKANNFASEYAANFTNTMTAKNKSNINFYALWEPNQYKIKLDSNGGVGNVQFFDATYDKNVKLPSKPYERKGYTFKGWSLEINGKVKYSNSANVKNLSEGSLSNPPTVTLYAVWERNNYNVKFSLNGGKGKTPATQKNCQYEKKKFTTPCKEEINNAGIEKAGYEFKGWNTKNDGSGYTYGCDKTSNIATTMNNQTITLYAMWEYDITVDIDGKQTIFSPNYFNQNVNISDINNRLRMLNNDKDIKKGYYIAGYATSKKNADKGSMKYTKTIKNAANEILYPVFKPIKYTVKFDCNTQYGGKGSMSNMSVTYDKKAKLTANKFSNTDKSKKFAYWSTKPDGTGKTFQNKEEIYNLTSNASEEVVLYAIWK